MKQINRHQIGGLFLVLLAACQPLSVSATGTFDFQQAADNHAARWEGVARFYEEMGLLNRQPAQYGWRNDRWCGGAPPVETGGGLFY